MLADPRLVMAQRVEVLDEPQVALHRRRRVLAGGVERGEEGTGAQSGHRVSMTWVTSAWLCGKSTPGRGPR
jgi:hypothetical protein